MKLKRIVTAVLLVCMVLSLMSAAVVAAETETVPMYRLYNPNSGEHFYTGSVKERDDLVAVGWNYEGIGWNAPVSSGAPVYRVFNPNSGDHHYTMSQEEIDMLVGLGWQYEGVCWNSPSTGSPQYRLYNPNADLGSHHYTSSVEERENLVSLGWIFEGIGWYGAVSEGHIHNYQKTVTVPTCTEQGYTTYTCACGDSYTGNETPAKGHDYKAQVIAPTTESYGYTLYTCENCGNQYEDDYVEKLPAETEPPVADCIEHSWGSWTSDSSGSYRSCDNCGEQQVVDGTGSNYADEAANIINEYRVNKGLSALTIVHDNFPLIRAQELTVNYAHARLDGSSYRRGSMWYSECIAGGYNSATAVANAWLNSSSHEPSLTDANDTMICVAYNGSFWVVMTG